MASYGTDQQNGGRANSNAADEETATLLSKTSQKPFRLRVKEHLSANVDKDYGHIPLLTGYVATGLLDSTAVYIYNCFVSMQTGNTIYLGLGLVEPQASDRWIKSLISILAFCSGSFLFSRLHQAFGGSRRWVLMASYLLQTTLLITSALIMTFGPHVTKETPVSVWIAVPLSLIAMQSAGQTYTSRALKQNGLTSVVLTSSYCDLFADAELFAGLTQNAQRNRRAVAPLLLLLGAFVGGVFAHSRFGIEAAIWTGVGLKLIVALAWVVFPAEKENDES